MSEAVGLKKTCYAYNYKSLEQGCGIPHMHCDNCDSTDEGTLFISKACFFLKYVVFKVGIHGHLSVSHIGDYRPYLGRHGLQRRGCPV